MITHISLANFKIYDEVEFSMAPLTILTGMNGMGKSSLIQALLLLRQSYPIDGQLDLGGDLIKLGTVGDVMCHYNNTGYLDISVVADEATLAIRGMYDTGDVNDTSVPLVVKTLCREHTAKDDGMEREAKLEDMALFNNNFQYISAFRFGPQNTYNRNSFVVGKNQMSKEKGQCEYVVNFIDAWKWKKLPIQALAIKDETEDETDYNYLTQLNRWMQYISPTISVKTVQSEESNEFRLRYGYNNKVRSPYEAKPINTGYGVTYALPIVAALLAAKPGSLVIIENPEAHIHPKGQSYLMKLVTQAANNGVQVIIETHSDHIINASLVALHDKIIGKKELAIYYFGYDEKTFEPKNELLDISDTGRIKRPPKGFFDQIDIDLKHILGF